MDMFSLAIILRVQHKHRGNLKERHAKVIGTDEGWQKDMLRAGADGKNPRQELYPRTHFHDILILHALIIVKINPWL